MTTAALQTKPANKRRALLALIKLADDEAQWLRFTDRDGKDTSMSPEAVRDLIDNRYYQDQEWKLISPLDAISDAALAMQIAHDRFQAIRRSVMAWYERRRVQDAAKDQQAHGDE